MIGSVKLFWKGRPHRTMSIAAGLAIYNMIEAWTHVALGRIT
ncbi:MAG TPA: hypothetical protein VIR04_09335 [Paralcaligenes sp.]